MQGYYVPWSVMSEVSRCIQAEDVMFDKLDAAETEC